MNWKSVFGIAIGLLFIVPAPSFSEGPSIVEIERLLDRQDYSVVLEQHRDYPWDVKTSPRRLMGVLYAEAELGRLADIESVASLPLPMDQFAQVYSRVLTGQTREARGLLREPSCDDPWGSVAALEYALYVGNYEIAPPHLDALECANVEWSPSWALPYYRFLYFMGVARYSTAFESVDDTEIVGSGLEPDYARALALVRGYAVSDCFIERAVSALGWTDRLIEVKAFRLRLADGPKAATNFLEQMLAEREGSTFLRKAHRFGTFDYARADAVDDALESIAALAEEDVDDVQYLVLVANLFMDMGRENLVRRILPLILHNGRAPTDLALYQLLLSKISEATGDIDEARSDLAAAKQMAPFDPEILWFAATFHAEHGSNEEAREALERLRTVDPYDTQVLVELADLAAQHEHWDDVLRLTEAIDRSPRHSPSWVAEKSQQLTLLASAHVLP